MTDDHAHIEELLAGYALRSLSGRDAAEADGLLCEHLPGCSRCRDTLDDLLAVTGALALAAEPIQPPATLLPRMKGQLDHRSSGRRPAILFAAAAALVVVVGLTCWNFLLNSKVSTAEQRRSAVSSMLNTILQENGSQMVALRSGDGSSPSPTPSTQPTIPPYPRPSVMVTFHPGVPHAWVFGTNIPTPEPGYVYEIWVGRSGTLAPAATFVPGVGGYVQEFIPLDLTQYEEVAITEEPGGISEVGPTGPLLWHAGIYP